MKNNKKNKDVTEIIGSFLRLLVEILILLKITGVINISWFLVFLPITICFILSGILYLFYIILKKMENKKSLS